MFKLIILGVLASTVQGAQEDKSCGRHVVNTILQATGHQVLAPGTEINGADDIGDALHSNSGGRLTMSPIPIWYTSELDYDGLPADAEAFVVRANAPRHYYAYTSDNTYGPRRWTRADKLANDESRPLGDREMYEMLCDLRRSLTLYGTTTQQRGRPGLLFVVMRTEAGKPKPASPQAPPARRGPPQSPGARLKIQLEQFSFSKLNEVRDALDFKRIFGKKFKLREQITRERSYDEIVKAIKKVCAPADYSLLSQDL